MGASERGTLGWANTMGKIHRIKALVKNSKNRFHKQKFNARKVEARRSVEIEDKNACAAVVLDVFSMLSHWRCGDRD
jgi:hypothetical protein